MRKALESLPGVEKDSVKVNMEQKLAAFKVKDPSTFAVWKAVKQINDLGGKYRATVNKTGKAVAARTSLPPDWPPKGDDSKKQ